MFEVFGTIVMIAAAVIMLAGGIFYNKLRSAYYGIIGVGGSYIILIAICVPFGLIAPLFGGESYTLIEIIMPIIVMIIGLGYMVYVMIARCETVMQRVFLPLVAVMIGFGFCWRFLLALVFHIPMGDGSPKELKFPQYLRDEQGETWELMQSGGDLAEYECGKTGARITIRHNGDYANIPTGWSAR